MSLKLALKVSDDDNVATIFAEGITDGTEEERARKTIAACEDFFRRMGLKTHLGECGITEKDLDALAAPVDKQGWKLGEHHNIDSRVAREIMALRL